MALVVPDPVPAPADGPTGGSSPITFWTDASPAQVIDVGGTPLEAYAGFLVARGTAAVWHALAARGHRADPMPDASTVRFLTGAVDARDLARSTSWSANGRGLTSGVVHVHAPFKEAWREAFERRGIEILRYIPENAFLVRGTPSAVRDLGSLPFVDGLGAFDPSWKVRPGMPSEGILDVRAVVLPGEPPEAVASWLSRRLGPAAEGPASGVGILGTYGSGDFRWVRARIPADLVPPLASRPEVEFVEPVRPTRLLNAEMAWVLQTNQAGDYRYWSTGLDGRGQVVGVADTGLDYDHDMFRESLGEIVLAGGDLFNRTDPARRKVVRYVNMGVLTGQLTWPGGGGTWDPWSIQDSDHTPTGLDCTFGHGTAVQSVLAGNDNWRTGGGDVDDGLALRAALYHQDVGTVGPDPSPTPSCLGDTDVLAYIPEDLADLFGPPDLVYNDPVAPVRIHSDSWGIDANEYDVQARSLDAFVWNHSNFTVLFASGNTGPTAGSVDSPGTAKNVVTVGGVGNPDGADSLTDQEDVAGLSSRGPTSDGRLKPTVLGIFDGDSAMSDGYARSGTGGPDDHWQGTSYATPSAAAAAAIIRQYFTEGWYPAARPVLGNAREPSAALLRAVLIASGTQVTGNGRFRPGADTWPNNEQGFGRITLSNVLPIAPGDAFRTRVVDASSGLVTGEVYQETVRVSGSRGLRFVLTWSDYPATLNAAKVLVNDLHLELTAPDGTVYLGNNFGTFSSGGSISGGSADTRNVEEAVIVPGPLPPARIGDWSVRVIGANVPVGPQPFALLVTGDLDLAYGRVALDRPSYGPGETVRLEVEDADASSVEVLVTSDFEPAGVLVPLVRSAPDETWRGSVPVSFGPTTEPGVQVRHGDTLRAEYDDGSPVHTSVATASIDGVGPTISDVGAGRPEPTSARVTWRTDEPATSAVWYGTSTGNLSSVAGASDLRTQHDMTLSGLAPDTLYYFDVVSRDRHGQETRDANGGRHHRFRTQAFGDVLLVIGDASFPPEREASWSFALGSNGWTWSFWRVADAGRPSLAVLAAHRAVIWQVGLEQYPPFDADERDLVKRYVDGGGRLLVVSHDTTWALADATSQYYSVDGGVWVEGVLKASLRCDPLTAGRIRGVSGDPIGGAFSGGVGYRAHRNGGALDELFLSSIGGPAASVFTDELVSGCTGGPVALRWTSSAPNGTAGTGAWAGTPSRLVYYAFEVTSADTVSGDLRPTSAVRAQIVDAGVRWLVSGTTTALDRDHPTVSLTLPIGGTFAGPTVPIEWTAADGGLPLAGFDLSYSADAGQSWTTFDSLSGTARSTAWDVTSLPNGDRYLVRIVARDTGTPSLSGADETDAFVEIRRAGGDASGPTIWAGSVRIAPNPPGAGTTATLTATADDRRSGAGTIAAIEYFLNGSEPSPADYGLGFPLDPADGAYDASVENGTWSDALPSAPGASCVWVHARDAGGNWGPFESSCFVVISSGPDATAPATAPFSAARLANGRADVEVVWSRAPDEGLYGGTTTYRVLRSATPRGPASDVSGPRPATGAPSYAFVDPTAGEVDPSDYFYRIESEDAAGNVAVTAAFAAKVRIAVAAGANLLGMSVDASEPSIGSLAGALPWTSAWAYDACGGSRWRSAVPSEAGAFRVHLGEGFWFNGTAGDLLAVGVVPAAARVDLCAGWNLIALPGFAAGITVGALRAATGADLVAGFDAAGPYHTRALADSEIVVPGRGLWVLVPMAATWTVPGA